MRRFRLAALAACVSLVAVAGPVTAGAGGAKARSAPKGQRAQANAFEIGHIPKCLEAVPAALPTGLPRPITLDVTVLVDGNPAIAPSTVMATAERSYKPLGITLRSTLQRVSFRGSSASGLIKQAKARFGGRRPSGSDVVLVLTDKDVEEDGNDNVAGLADCIGGVAFPDRAFAVSEVFSPAADRFAVGRVSLLNNLSAKVAAHEIGHLLGAHHHYANCAEGIPSELTQLEVSPCTLMFNSVDGASLNFSTANGLVVRGHAEAYARP